MIITVLVTLATLTVAPNIQYTHDSVYKSDRIIEIGVQERYEEEELKGKDLIFTEHYVAGYTIYDNLDTPYIDGLKVDDTFVTDWKFENYDDSVTHTIHIKTVYTDDVAGALAAASHGDFSKFMSNPIMLLQLCYFSLALIMVIVTLIANIRSKLKKNAEEHTLEKKCEELLTNIVVPLCTKVKTSNESILKALILAKSGKAEDSIALINLLEASTTDDLSNIIETVKTSILQEDATKKALKEKAETTLNNIADGVYKSIENKNDGTDI